MSGAPRGAVAAPKPQKPRALQRNARVALFAPASPARPDKITAGVAELRRLGFSVRDYAESASEGYFAATAARRAAEFSSALGDKEIDALVAIRGGYGSNYLLQQTLAETAQPKIIVGFSDLTTLQIYLWQRRGWISFYGPMVAAGFDAGDGAPGGYDAESFHSCTTRTAAGWSIGLNGETLFPGSAEGRILGGALTLVEATFGTPWELDTRDAILVLEDRAMKPYQIDRVLMHFKQAGKFDGVRGIVLGEFPECEPPPILGSPSVRDICRRILGDLRIPIVFGAAVGHTPRPMLALPLGVQARLLAEGGGALAILEPAVTP